MKLPSKPQVLRLSLGFVTGGFLILTSIAMYLVHANEKALDQKTYDSTGIASMQLRIHYEAVMEALALIDGGLPEASVGESVLRFDIFFERIQALPDRPAYKSLLDEEMLSLQSDIMATLNTILPKIDRAADGDETALHGLRQTLNSIRPKIQRLAHRPVQVASERRCRECHSDRGSYRWRGNLGWNYCPLPTYRKLGSIPLGLGGHCVGSRSIEKPPPSLAP